MKALEILNRILRFESATDDEVLRAIIELEALQNKTCDGCRYYVQINNSDSFVCSLSLDCSRKYKPKDRFEPKG